MTATAPVRAGVPTAPPRRRGRASWWRDLVLGVRLSVGGGRAGWSRLALIAGGVGVGVAVLLTATAIPAAVGGREGRVTDRYPVSELVQDSTPTDRSVIIQSLRSDFRASAIEGRLIQAEGDDPVLPPGVERALAPGEILLSPALARLMESEAGEALRGRWSDDIVGEIGEEGLTGPKELTFYLGADGLQKDQFAERVTEFGGERPGAGAEVMVLILGLLAAVVVLLPVVIFIITAVRVGGEARDRRLAAVRLVGADTGMIRRIAAGETLAGAVLGLLVGAVLFTVVAHFAPRVVPADMSFFSEDFRPVPIYAALVVVLVPVASVIVTVSAMQRLIVDPLGVVRRGVARSRRLWWRLPLIVVGLGLLAVPWSSRGSDDGGGNVAMVALAAGLVFLFVGIVLILPWLVEATVRRMRPGGVARQLAVRRLQLESGTASRAVSGITVSVAGLIALHGAFGAVGAMVRDDASPWTEVHGAQLGWVEGLPAVQDAELVVNVWGSANLVVGECAALTHWASVESCHDGDVFTFEREDSGAVGTTLEDSPALVAGSTVELTGIDEDTDVEWTLPSSTRAVASTDLWGPQLFATPGAVDGLAIDTSDTQMLVALAPSVPDAIDHLRTAVSQHSVTARVESGDARFTGSMKTAQQVLMGVSIAVLVMIGASLLVNMLEQLRERRQLLAVLLAFGTRRSTLSGSVLYQVAIPVGLGVVLAVVTGTGISMILQSVLQMPIQVDVAGIAATAGAAVAVVLLATAATQPLLWRLTGGSGLRTE